MKHSDLLKAYLLIAFASIILPACKKDKNNKNDCTIVAAISGGTTWNNNVTYNDDATVSYKLTNSRIYTWHYPGTITIMGEPGDLWYQKAITLNEYGMLTNFSTFDDASHINWHIDTYSYQNGVQLIRSHSENGKQFPVDYLYTWLNGNLITKTYQGPGEDKYIFGYSSNRASATGDYFTYQNISNYQGFRVLGSKNLPISIQFSVPYTSDNYFDSFSYKYDMDRKIKTMTFSSESGQSSVDYVYQCSGDNYSK